MSDRLQEAKHLAGAAGSSEDGIIRWLIAEVERLRAVVERQEEIAQGKVREQRDEIERLRMAKRQLVTSAEQLSEANTSLARFVGSMAADILVLKTALQALYDATACAAMGIRIGGAGGGILQMQEWQDDAKKIDAARGAAGRLLNSNQAATDGS